MRNLILRAGIVTSLVAIATAARADLPTAAIAREPAVGCSADASPGDAGSASAWITDTLIGALNGTARTMTRAAVLLDSAAAPNAARQLSAKPHQNPAFPAAFVFQSNSASFLALATQPRTERRVTSGS